MNQNTFCKYCHRIPSQCGCTHPAEHDLGVAEAIGFDKGYKAASVKELTDEAIITVADPLNLWDVPKDKLIDFARAILRKAQE